MVAVARNSRSFACASEAQPITVRAFMLSYESGDPCRMSPADAQGLTELFRVAIGMGGSDDADSIRSVLRKVAKAGGYELRTVMNWPMSRLAGISSDLSLKA